MPEEDDHIRIVRLEEGLKAHIREVELREVFYKEALRIANISLDKHLESLNNERARSQQDRSSFVSREVHDQQVGRIDERYNENAQKIATVITALAETKARLSTAVAAVSLALLL